MCTVPFVANTGLHFFFYDGLFILKGFREWCEVILFPGERKDNGSPISITVKYSH